MSGIQGWLPVFILLRVWRPMPDGIYYDWKPRFEVAVKVGELEVITQPRAFPSMGGVKIVDVTLTDDNWYEFRTMDS